MATVDPATQLRDQIKHLMEHRQMVQAFKESPGYDLFLKAFQPGIQLGQVAAFDAKDPFMMAKHMSAVKVLVDVTSWADREILACEANIRSLRKELDHLSNHR